ncbi:117_t:CDS:2 [Diversispora eburnea]|uniref:117_t:CDS:1 n=1 Tax=Diversispora eburnea TaxID=1213867 RepID=A0A9N8YYF1_9GLOM|nr:117_t:CDS:2 [Diversispora eburnea]
MSTELLLSLATDYIQLLQYPEEDFNVLIKIGENNNYQEFKAHSVILRSSCSSLMNLLVAADELCLNQLVDYAQDYFVANGLNWLCDNFYDVLFTIFAHDNFEKLQKSCSKIIAHDPKNHRHYFTQWPEKLILEVLQREDLQLEEIDVWDTILRWGAAQVGLSTRNVAQWTQDDFSRLSDKLKNCIQHIRFYHISVADFSNRVLPFSNAISDEAYNEIFQYLLMRYTINLLPPRGILLDSEIIGIRHAALIASWIDRQETYNRPCFGVSDLVMVVSSGHSWGKFLYNFPWTCKQSCYEFPITKNSYFAIDNYEVFKLVRKGS